jgi:hypothetical protein
MPLFKPPGLIIVLIAVLGGNLTYLGLSPYLPSALQHQPFQLDWGLAADFWICLVWWGGVDLLYKGMKKWRGLS